MSDERRAEARAGSTGGAPVGREVAEEWVSGVAAVGGVFGIVVGWAPAAVLALLTSGSEGGFLALFLLFWLGAVVISAMIGALAGSALGYFWNHRGEVRSELRDFRRTLRERRRLVIGLLLGPPLAIGGAMAGYVAWHEARYTRFAEVAHRHGVDFHVEWRGPDMPWLREYCDDNGWWGFYEPAGFSVGSIPKGAVTGCLPTEPENLMEFRSLRNPNFDNAALAEVVAAVPNPEAIGEQFNISDCEVDAEGLRLLTRFPALKSVLWLDPHVSKEEVERVRSELPFHVSTYRPEDCDQMKQTTE